MIRWVTGRFVVLGVVTALLSGTLTHVSAAALNVRVTDNAFDPDVVRVAPGGEVSWLDAGSDQHNVREDSKLFRSGEPTTNMDDFTVRFSAGTFHYYCEIHGSPRGGMDGVVRVAPTVRADPDGLEFGVRWASDTSNSGTSFDVDYRVGSRAWETWKSRRSAVKAVFGRGDRPVALKAGTRYSFRARSRKGADVSGWSPVESFSP
jgi:plastocyanin